MTLISQPKGDPQESAAHWPLHPSGSVAEADGPALDVWLVTMPTVGANGTLGTQSFAVRARTALQAIEYATEHAGSTRAVRRRGGARICPPEAHATPWSAYRL
ncbi:hypothetical protein [Streptomyces sp. NPDC005017]|uniref:hypothetical protein n=1 Tax=Streptomyces sp. NPDC005017 TaxID=3364706 RepID=UPI00367D0EC9